MPHKDRDSTQPVRTKHYLTELLINRETEQNTTLLSAWQRHSETLHERMRQHITLLNSSSRLKPSPGLSVLGVERALGVVVLVAWSPPVPPPPTPPLTPPNTSPLGRPLRGLTVVPDAAPRPCRCSFVHAAALTASFLGSSYSTLCREEGVDSVCGSIFMALFTSRDQKKQQKNPTR